MVLYKDLNRDFPGGPVVKNPPSNGGNVGSIPGQGTKIPQATKVQAINKYNKFKNHKGCYR